MLHCAQILMVKQAYVLTGYFTYFTNLTAGLHIYDVKTAYLPVLECHLFIRRCKEECENIFL